MATKKKSTRNNFESMFVEFGKAMEKVFNDPQLRAQSRLLGKMVSRSATTLKKSFQDPKVRNHFKNMGTAAERFGRDVSKYVDKKKDDLQDTLKKEKQAIKKKTLKKK